MGKKIFYIFFLPLAIVLFMGCDRHRQNFLHQYASISCPDGWKRQDTMEIMLPPMPQTQICSLALGVRMRPNYPYQDMVVELDVDLKQPELHLLDTCYLRVADSLLARPLGKGVVLHTVEQPIMQLHLHQGQRGRFRLRHLMSCSPLPAVSDVGLCLWGYRQ